MKRRSLSASDSITLFPTSLRISDKETGLAEITCSVEPEGESYRVEVRLDRDPAAPGRFRAGGKGLIYQVRAKLMTMRAPLVRARLKAKVDGAKNARIRWSHTKAEREALQRKLCAWFRHRHLQRPNMLYGQVVADALDMFNLSSYTVKKFTADLKF